MDQKVRTYIDKVTVNERTYHNVSFEPTLINFFFGKNGSGKSTIARAIRSKKPLSWHPGSSSDTVLMVYNEDYIRDNIQSYGNIPGVFTMSEVNARIKKEVDEKTKERSDARIQQRTSEEAGTELKGRYDTLDDRHAAKVWDKTEQWRKTDFHYRLPLSPGSFRHSCQADHQPCRYRLCTILPCTWKFGLGPTWP